MIYDYYIRVVEILSDGVLLTSLPVSAFSDVTGDPEPGRGGNIYATETGKQVNAGLFLFVSLLNIYQHTTKWNP